MYCPRCGQQQISDQTKFCSRCGFLLALVGDVLQNNGTLPELEALNQAPKGLFTRRNGILFSVIWFMFFLLIMTPFWGIADVEEMAALCAVLGIFGGLIFLITSLVVLKKPTKSSPSYQPIHVPQQQPATLYGAPQHPALPAQQMIPANEYTAPQGSWRTPDTGEFAVPGSVTDSTTKLLTKED